jgi:hypothetical protein
MSTFVLRSSSAIAIVAMLSSAFGACGGGGDGDASPPQSTPRDSGVSSDVVAPTDTARSADTGSAAPDADGGPTPTANSIDILDLPIPIDLSPDGTLAVIEDVLAPDTPLWFYDTVGKTLTKKTTVGDPSMDAATAVSANGRVSAEHGNPETNGVWSEGAGWLDFDHGDPPCDAFLGGAFDISADGHIVVGLNWNGCRAQAYAWSDASGKGVMTILQQLGTAAEPTKQPDNRSTVISDDGTTIGGFAENGDASRSPAMWNVADGTGFLLNPDGKTGDDMGEVLSISADGKVTAGLTNGYVGFVWTKEKGMVKIPQLDTAAMYAPTYLMSISAGGALLFGNNGTAVDGDEIAIVWTEAKGQRVLQDVVRAAGVKIPDDIQLTHALASSQDGSVVLGAAVDAKGNHHTYVLHLAPDAYTK